MIAVSTPPPDSLQARRSVRYIVGHYGMTNLGYFGLLSTLVVTLNMAGFDAGHIAILVMVFTITTKIAKLPLAPWLDRLPIARSVLVGCSGAAIGFITLAFSAGFAATAAALVLVGTGISVNALASKQLAAGVSDQLASRARLFSIINVGINVASAIAAPLALALVASGHGHRHLLLLIAAIYATAGVTTWINFTRLDLRRPGGGASLRSYVELMRRPGLPAFLVINLFGWMMYGQLFNALALHVSQTLAEADHLGWLYTVNALLVIGLQIPMTAWTLRWFRGRPMSIVLAAYATFTAAFVLPSVVPGYAGALTFVVVFTLAEMMFVPSVDVLLLDLIGSENRAVGYSVLSISTALGESIGGGIGVVSYRWLSEHGAGGSFWFALAALSFACVGVTWWLQCTDRSLRVLPSHV